MQLVAVYGLVLVLAALLSGLAARTPLSTALLVLVLGGGAWPRGPRFCRRWAGSVLVHSSFDVPIARWLTARTGSVVTPR